MAIGVTKLTAGTYEMPDIALVDTDIDQLWRKPMSKERIGIRELSLEMLEQVSGSGGGIRVRQSIDSSPSRGTSYNGDNFDTDPVSGGYIGDGNYLRPF